MKDVGIVQGGVAQAIPLVIGKDRVDLHTDIVPVAKDHNGNAVEGLFSYHEIQYEKDEYIKLMAEKGFDSERQATDLQLAVCEIYELIGV